MCLKDFFGVGGVWRDGVVRTYMKPCSCHGSEIKDQIIPLGTH